MSMLLEAGLGGSRRRRRGFAPVAFSPTQLFASGEQGVWYDPSDLTAAKVSWRRNLLTRTEEFNDAAWTKGGNAGISANQTTAPDGTVTADSYQQGTSPASDVLRQNVSVAGSGPTVTLSWYAKLQLSGPWLVVGCGSNNADTNSFYGWVNLSTGAVGSTAVTGTGVVTSLTATSAGDGWYRIVLVGSVPSATAYRPFVYITGADNTTTRVAQSRAYLWGAQLELGSTATTYQRITDFNLDFLAAFPNTALFQNSAGTTPVTALGQPVGLVLDKSRWDGRGVVNLLTDTEGFTTGWSSARVTRTLAAAQSPINTLTATRVSETATTGVHFVSQTVAYGGTATFSVYAKADQLTWLHLSANSDATVVTINLSTGAISTAVGSPVNASATSAGNGWWRLSFAVSTVSNFFVLLSKDGVWANRSYAGDGTSGLFLWGAQVESGSTATAYQANGASVGGPGNHARQTTDAARPTLQARSNLFERTEEFDNAYWTKTGLNAFGSGSVANTTATTDPLGTNTADFIQENTGTGEHRTSRLFSPLVLATYTFSFYAKAATRTWCALNFSDTADRYTWFNLSNGTVGTNASGSTASIVDAGNGWYRCIVSRISAGTGVNFLINIATGNNVTSYTGDGTSGIYIWGAQLELGASATTYQRVTTATDYADIGLPRYLQFDGTDDSLVTAATVDFSGTNQMTVCGGVFKQSDTAYGAILDLTADPDNTNGGFAYGVSTATGDASRRTYGLVFRRTVPSIKSAYIYAAPDLKVFTGQYDGAQSTANTQLTIRLNGATPTTAVGASNATSGVFANAQMFVGRRNQASSPFNGRIHQLIVRGALTSGAQLTSTEQWVAQKTGVVLP